MLAGCLGETLAGSVSPVPPTCLHKGRMSVPCICERTDMRCFVAIELPAAIREKLAEFQRRLAPLDSQVRWTRPENIHLTLKFLGEVADGQIGEVCSTAIAVASRLPPIAVEVAGCGCFPPRGAARVIWAGVVGASPELAACQRACGDAFAELGFPPEERAFRPHLTIGRARDPRGSREARTALDRVSSIAAGTFTATEMVVFQSVLSGSGSTYAALARAKFLSSSRG